VKHSLGIIAVLLVSSAACSAPTPRQPDRPLIVDKDGQSTWSKGRSQSGAVHKVATNSADRIRRFGSNTLPQKLVDRILKGGPGMLLSLVPLRPIVSTKRQFLGFEIERVHDNSPQVLRYGVRPGDRLVRVNRIKILRPNDMMALFERLRNATELVIELNRAGQRKRVVIPIVAESKATATR